MSRVRLAVPALAAAASLAFLPAPALATTKPARWAATVYLADTSNAIRTVNAATDTPGPVIPLPYTPRLFAASHCGRTLYVAAEDDLVGPAAFYVIPIDTATDTAGTPIPVPHVYEMAMAPDGRTLYTVGGSGITPIDTATDTAGATIPAGKYPQGIILSPSGQEAYVADPIAGTITPVNLATGTPGTPITTGALTGTPPALAITPDGGTLYVGEDLPGGSGIDAIDTATGTAAPPVRMAGNWFNALQFAPGSTTLWAALSNGFIDRFDTATGTVLPPIHIRGDPATLAVPPRGRDVFAGQLQRWGHVVPVNPVTGIRGPDIPAARGISAMALAPGGGTLWAAGNTSQTVMPISTATATPGRPVHFPGYVDALIVVRHRV